MGNFMLYLIFSFYVLVGVSCHDEIIILHAPSALNFRNAEELNRSNLKNVLAAALGYSVETARGSDEWDGMEVKNPFGCPKALYVLHFPGMDSFNSDRHNLYSVIPDEKMEVTWNELMEETEQRFPNKNSELKKVILGDPSQVTEFRKETYEIDVSSSGPFESINSSRPNSENDNMFIKELNKLHKITDELLIKSNKNGKPDLFWVTVPNLSQIVALRDGDSKDILLNALTTLSDKIKKNYDDKVLIVALAENEESLKRSKRQTSSEEKKKTTLSSLNVAQDYDEDFPIIFNIIFWFSLAMLFAVIAICMVIGGMDPGRDSIIYRMTSTRMKKDN